LLTPCEVTVKTVSPAIRALIAHTLIEKHELTEYQVAQLLGISQSAVSKYNKKVRGSTINIEDIPEVQALTDQMAVLLLATPVQQLEIMKLFCQACNIIRRRGLMCPLCQPNHKPNNGGCDFCR